MVASAALSGDYVDLKFVKGRGVAVIHVEIPIEQAPDFVKAFGTPMPGTGVPVAMARLMAKGSPQTEEAPKERRKWADLPLPQQAALLCDREAFWAYIRERHGANVRNADQAADILRHHCGVASRSELKPGTAAAAAFLQVQGDFDVWMRAAA